MNRSFATRHPARRLTSTALAWVAALMTAGCGGDIGSDDPVPGEIVSSATYVAPADIASNASDSRKLVYWMTGQGGALVRATTLLFVPKGAPPAGGWPVVAWVHGTQTVGTGSPAAAACSASESATLDGNLTADGFSSHYADTVAALLGAGYAVVAPDLEGFGAQAESDGTRSAYYNQASSGRSVAGALLAAHQAVSTLSSNWASVGHSEGGHAVLGLETTTGEAARYAYKGTVAFAPFSNVDASVQLVDALVAADPANTLNYRVYQNNTVLMMATALNVQRPNWSPGTLMGSDLAALLPQAKQLCSLPLFGAVAQGIATKGVDSFQGYDADWSSESTGMQSFLQANDIAISSSFAVAKPTLVLQGSADPLVFESLQTPFMQRLKTAGMPVTYSVHAGADHASIMVDGRAEMLSFLQTLFP